MIYTSNEWKQAQTLPLLPEANIRLILDVSPYQTIYDKSILKNFKYTQSGSIENKIIPTREIVFECFDIMFNYDVGTYFRLQFGLKINGSWEYIFAGIFQIIKKTKKANEITTKYELSDEYTEQGASSEIYEYGSYSKAQGLAPSLKITNLALNLNIYNGNILPSSIRNAICGSGLTRVSYGEARQKLGISVGKTIKKELELSHTNMYKFVDVAGEDETLYRINRMNYYKKPEIEPLKYTNNYIINYYNSSQSAMYDTLGSYYIGHGDVIILNIEVGKYFEAVATNPDAWCSIINNSIHLYGENVSTDINAYYSTNTYEQKTFTSYFIGNDPTIIDDPIITSDLVDVAGNYLVACSSYSNKITLDMRIDPCLEMFDKVLIEEDDCSWVNCVIEKIEMNFNGVFKGKITVRTNNEISPTKNYFYVESKSVANNTISVVNPNGSTNYPFEYSYDAENWEAYTGTITLNKYGKKVFFRGNNATLNDDVLNDNYWQFVFGDKVNIGGDISSLYDKTMQNKEIPASKFFARLFKGNANLISAKNLNLTPTTLKAHCYWEMFADCTQLINAPQLPALILADYCYESMFWGCTSLETAPDLPATSISTRCYSYMFWGCTALRDVPFVLPARTLYEGCYKQMFYGCSSLYTSPVLPAENIAPSCYMDMFAGCSSLAICPELPATTLYTSCYDGMFRRCTALIAMPNLPATVMADWCYASMFELCENLEYIVSLPSTQLANGCYGYMFIKCYALAKLHNLPATNLPKWCYINMYDGCSNIKLATSQGGVYQTPYRIPTSGSATVGTNALLEMFTSTGGTFVGTPTAETVYYTSNALV